MEPSFPLLTAIIATPAIGAVVVLLISKRYPGIVRLVGFAFSIATLALCIYLLTQFDQSDPGFQFVSRHVWIEPLGISWYVGVDGISLFMVVLTGVMFPILMAGSDPVKQEKPYTVWLLLSEASALGVFLALDLFLFFVFFELTIIPLYFLIAGWGYKRRLYAATKFILYTLFGSAFMLVGLIALVVLNERATGVLSFDMVALAESQNVIGNAGRWIFLSFGIAFAVKTPLFPVHTWLPDAHTEAPTAGSVDLAAVMLKLGSYGMVRFGLYLFPEASVFFAPLMMTLGVVGIVYGGVVAAMQHNIKRLVAYSSVAHMGFVVLGIFALTTQGLTGGVLVMVNHGITTGALFILLHLLYERRHSYEMADLKGLQTSMPIIAAVFTVSMLASIGVPGLNGFVGEFLVLVGTFVSARWWAVVAVIGVIVAAVYMLWAYQRVFHGEPDEPNRNLPDLRLKEGLVIAPLVALMVFIGLYPKPVLDRIEPSVKKLLEHVELNSDYRQPEVSVKGGD